MRIALAAEVERPKTIQIQRIPWILDWYKYPFDRWSSPHRQSLFGSPFFLLFAVYQKLWPFTARGHFHYRIGPEEKSISFNSKNTQFRALYLQEFKDGYEPLTTALIRLLVPAEATFYDIGSNWGWFSLSLAARPGFSGRIHAFEPFPSSYQDLRSTVRQAGLEQRIQCHNVALSDVSGKGDMKLPDFMTSGLASLEAGNGGGIAVATLDSLPLEAPYMLKVDVEGAEAKVFRGGTQMLKKHRPMIVFESCRFHGDVENTLEPLVILNELGYVFYRLAWHKTRKQGDYYVGDEADFNVQPRETLTLVEFNSDERFLFPDGLNIFACHRDRLPELEQKFRKV